MPKVAVAMGGEVLGWPAAGVPKVVGGEGAGLVGGGRECSGGFGLGGHGPPSLWRVPHRIIVVNWKFCMLPRLGVCVSAEAACWRASARDLSVYIYIYIYVGHVLYLVCAW